MSGPTDHEAAARKVCAENLYLHRDGSEPDNNCKLCAAIVALLEATDDKWREEWEQSQRERNSAREALSASTGADYWVWQDDGGDHLESMGESMVVQMTAGTLRAMLKATDRAAREDCAKKAGKRSTLSMWSSRPPVLDWLELFYTGALMTGRCARCGEEEGMHYHWTPRQSGDCPAFEPSLPDKEDAGREMCPDQGGVSGLPCERSSRHPTWCLHCGRDMGQPPAALPASLPPSSQQDGRCIHCGGQGCVRCSALHQPTESPTIQAGRLGYGPLVEKVFAQFAHEMTSEDFIELALACFDQADVSVPADALTRIAEQTPDDVPECPLCGETYTHTHEVS